MEKNEIDLLNRVYQNAKIGELAIDKVLKKINNQTLKKLFEKQNNFYEKFAEKCDILAINEDVEIKDNNFFKKLKQTTMLYISLWTDSSARHIVEMMITGIVMGIVDCIKAQKDAKCKNENLNATVQEYMQIQEDFYEKLKKQLSKV